jgi:sulfur transfer protein SufE
MRSTASEPGAAVTPSAGAAYAREVIPAPLADLLAELESLDRPRRTELLLGYADRYIEVPASVAARPYSELHRVPRCESEAYVFPVDNADGTVTFHFAIESPVGVSARAWAAILGETCSSQPLEQVARIPADAVYHIFGRDLSMGKGQGLIGMADLVSHAARRRLAARHATRPETG